MEREHQLPAFPEPGPDRSAQDRRDDAPESVALGPARPTDFSRRQVVGEFYRQAEPHRRGPERQCFAARELAADQDADVLCLESNYLQSGDARKLLWRYLSNGRGVFLLVNRLTPAIKGHLRELGFQAEETIDRGKEAAERFQFVAFNHPVF